MEAAQDEEKEQRDQGAPADQGRCDVRVENDTLLYVRAS